MIIQLFQIVGICFQCGIYGGNDKLIHGHTFSFGGRFYHGLLSLWNIDRKAVYRLREVFIVCLLPGRCKPFVCAHDWILSHEERRKKTKADNLTPRLCKGILELHINYVRKEKVPCRCGNTGKGGAQ